MAARPGTTFVALSLLWSGGAVAASFDCAKAGADAVARTICANPSLSDLDSTMGSAYQALVQLQGHRPRASQRQWIKLRNRCGPKVDCLAATTQARLSELNQQLAMAQSAQPLLTQLSQAWTQDEDLAGHASQVHDDLGSCAPGVAVPAAAPSAVPPSYVRLETLASHHCETLVTAYLGCTEAIEESEPSAQWVAANGKLYACAAWDERLVLQDLPGGSSRVLGDLEPDERTGNSEALFVPSGYSKDDRDIVLKAWMGSPGAGGGRIVYGDELLSRATGHVRRARRP